MIGILRDAKGTHWYGALVWLFYTLLSALPFWGVAFLLWLANRDVTAAIFVNDAQLAVYSAGLLASAIPVMQSHVNGVPFRHHQIFVWMAVTVVILASLLFTLVTLSGQLSGGPEPFNWSPDEGRVLVASVALAAAALMIGFLTELTNHVRYGPDVRDIGSRQVNDLQRQVAEKRRANDEGR